MSKDLFVAVLCEEGGAASCEEEGAGNCELPDFSTATGTWPVLLN